MIIKPSYSHPISAVIMQKNIMWKWKLKGHFNGGNQGNKSLPSVNRSEEKINNKTYAQ